LFRNLLLRVPLELESGGTRAPHPANNECPEYKGKGEVPQPHGGLRQKTCP
jgi:hypothetical protein